MILTPEEIKEQTRALWHQCFPADSEDFLDIYFDEVYADDINITAREGAEVVAAAQLIPYAMTFNRERVHAGYVSGLCTHPSHRKRGHATAILHEAHRRLYHQGALFSILIPSDEQMRHFYENPAHGAYWTATYQHTLTLDETPADWEKGIVIDRELEWGDDLFVYYNTVGGCHSYELKAAESTFFAAVATCDLEDGSIFVARRKGRIVGFCMVRKPANGKVLISFMLTRKTLVMDALVRHLMQTYPDCAITMCGPVPGSFEGAQPYAMARVVNVMKFLSLVSRIYPKLEMHIGVQEDRDVPENNGYYLIKNGRCRVVDDQPTDIITPGGLAALFLAAQPVMMPFMLDK